MSSKGKTWTPSIIALLSRPVGASRSEFNARLVAEASRRVADEPTLVGANVFVIDDDLEKLAAATAGPGGATFDAMVAISGYDQGAAHAVLADALGHETCHAYRVETRPIKTCSRTWAVGERTPGLVMVSPVYRADHLSAREFDEYWRDGHAPLALRHHVGMWDYKQNPVREVLTDGSPPYDGIALLGFPSIDAFTGGLFDSPEGTEIIMTDTKRFLALDRSQSTLMAEFRLRG